MAVESQRNREDNKGQMGKTIILDVGNVFFWVLQRDLKVVEIK